MHTDLVSPCVEGSVCWGSWAQFHRSLCTPASSPWRTSQIKERSLGLFISRYFPLNIILKSILISIINLMYFIFLKCIPQRLSRYENISHVLYFFLYLFIGWGNTNQAKPITSAWRVRILQFNYKFWKYCTPNSYGLEIIGMLFVFFIIYVILNLYISLILIPF